MVYEFGGIMEKLIHILPNLITNEDSSWLRKKIANPDELTQEIMRHFNNKIYTLAVMKRFEFNNQLNSFGGKITDESTVEDLSAALEEIPVETNYSYLLDEFASRFDCSGKSLTSVIWGTAILNSIEGKGVDNEVIQKFFYTVANTMLKSDKNVEMLCQEVREVVKADSKFADAVDMAIAYGLLLNKRVQEADAWFDFTTLKELETATVVTITSQEELVEALRNFETYNGAIEYIKDNYLSETDPKKDGYCENDVDRTYKAYIIAATLASESFKHNPEFDPQGKIGFNLTADILNLREKIDSEHILSGISNKLNGLEDAAGRIVCEILGRDIFEEADKQKKPRFILPKETFRTGSVEDYIKNNLNSFEKLINPNLAYCQDLLTSLEKIESKYAKIKVYRQSENTNNALAFIASEFGVELPAGFETKEDVLTNVTFLQATALDRYDELNRMNTIFKRVKMSQKDNLNIEELAFDRKVLKRDDTVKATLHEDVIKEFYRAVAADPVLKGDRRDKLRLKSPKMVMAEIKDRVDGNAESYPQLARLLSRFSLSTQERMEKIVDRYYVNEDGSINRDYKEVYEIVTEPKTTKDQKFDAIADSKMSDADKESLVELMEPEKQ